MSAAAIHPTAVCDTRELGSGVMIGSHSSVEEGARIGNDVIIKSGVHLYCGMVVEDGVHIGTNATFASARLPGDSQGTDQPIVLRKGCVIGANATLCAGVTVGEQAIVAGNPAKVVGFADTPATHVQAPARSSGHVQQIESKVRGVRAFQLPFISDPRGNLTVGEFERGLPFAPLRYFITFDVPSASMRGEHAHKECEQFLICVRGSCNVVVDDGTQREEFVLDRPTFGVYVPPMVWATEYKHSADSTLMVFASHHYDPADYIRDYDEFLAATKAR